MNLDGNPYSIDGEYPRNNRRRNTMSNKTNLLIDDSDQFLLPVGRVLFHNLFVPVSFKDKDGNDQPAKFGVTMMFPPEEQFTEYKAALGRLKKIKGVEKYAVLPGSAEEAKQLAMGLDAESIIYMDDFFKRLKKPFKKETNPDKLEKYPHQVNQWICNLKTAFAPFVCGPGGKEDKITLDNKDLIYGGCYGQALVSVGIYNGEGIFLRLKGFQKQKNGTPFSGGGVTASLFKTFTEDAFGDSSLAEDFPV
jgi:Protein of unknown function (DUF2815)